MPTAILTAVVALVSVALGAAINHLLTRSREREQWLLERRQEEFRELLPALSDAYMEMLNYKMLIPLNSESQKSSRDAGNHCVRVIRDRILIAAEINQDAMANDWLRAMRRYEQTGESVQGAQDLPASYEAIRKVIITAAMRGLKLKSTMQALQQAALRRKPQVSESRPGAPTLYL